MRVVMTGATSGIGLAAARLLLERPEAKLLTGSGARFLRQSVAGGAGEASSQASDRSLWWPPAKVAAPYLTPYLQGLDGDSSAIWHG